MAYDEISVEEIYDHEALEDVVEMRPTSDGCYAGPNLRDNDDRSLVGLPDWQCDFPVDSPTRLTLDELLSIFL